MFTAAHSTRPLRVAARVTREMCAGPGVGRTPWRTPERHARVEYGLNNSHGGLRETAPTAVHRSNSIAHNTERRQRGARSLGVPLWARRLSSALLSSENFTPPRWRPEKGLPARLHLSDCRSRMRPTPSKPCALSPPPPHQPRHICSTPSNLVARWPPRHGCAVPATWPACLAASARCWRSCGARGWDG